MIHVQVYRRSAVEHRVLLVLAVLDRILGADEIARLLVKHLSAGSQISTSAVAIDPVAPSAVLPGMFGIYGIHEFTSLSYAGAFIVQKMFMSSISNLGKLASISIFFFITSLLQALDT